jgi:hypothetical protein
LNDGSLDERCQAELPPREALRRAMNIKPPPDWKATMKNSKAANLKKRAARLFQKRILPASRLETVCYL